MDEWKDCRPNLRSPDQRQLIEVDTKFTALIGDLKAVKQEKQLMSCDWMCQHAMKILPRIYKVGIANLAMSAILTASDVWQSRGRGT